jgi:two-component system, chemotaxis family, protein-glutamate methylesterase/glutaminase
VDHCVPLQQIAPLLTRLVGAPAAAERAAAVPEQVMREVAINRGEASMDHLASISDPSTLTCPDCGGSLWQVRDPKPLRYRCHTGHAYSSLSLARAQKDTAEAAIWSGVRALRERELLLRRVASIAEATGDVAQARAGLAQAERLKRQMLLLKALAEELPPGMELDAAA